MEIRETRVKEIGGMLIHLVVWIGRNYFKIVLGNCKNRIWIYP